MQHGFGLPESGLRITEIQPRRVSYLYGTIFAIMIGCAVSERKNKMAMKWKSPFASLLLVALLQSPAFSEGAGTQSQITPAALDGLYSAYLEIQSALAKDDLERALDLGGKFAKQPGTLPRELSHGVKAGQILGDLAALNRAKDITEYRKAFSPFSEHMALLMSEVKYQGKKPVLEFRCPMANGNKGGKWLQAEKELANPYFGSAMLTCGSLQKSLHEGTEKSQKEGGAATQGSDAHGSHR